jgi:hypothetical protein
MSGVDHGGSNLTFIQRYQRYSHGPGSVISDCNRPVQVVCVTWICIIWSITIDHLWHCKIFKFVSSLAHLIYYSNHSGLDFVRRSVCPIKNPSIVSFSPGIATVITEYWCMMIDRYEWVYVCMFVSHQEINPKLIWPVIIGNQTTLLYVVF